jgi:hypothetical protein
MAQFTTEFIVAFPATRLSPFIGIAQPTVARKQRPNRANIVAFPCQPVDIIRRYGAQGEQYR